MAVAAATLPRSCRASFSAAPDLAAAILFIAASSALCLATVTARKFRMTFLSTLGGDVGISSSESDTGNIGFASKAT